MFKVFGLSVLLGVARAGNLIATYSPGLTYPYPATVKGSVVPTYYYHQLGPQIGQIHAPAVGTTHQSTVRSFDGNSAVSHYSKSVDTAFSSVSKVDTRVTNDAKYLTPGSSPTTTFAYPSGPYYSSLLPYAHYSTSAVVQPQQIVKTVHAPTTAYGSPYAYAAPTPGHVVSHHTTFTGLGATYAF
ncbi:cuticle protein LPCP-23-like [Prorops nasuta]|uniref:cuticle protein LPCP-23-like n=1 Tax=Prorops nasuta TaxID=863751 RepID=UPI0034CE4A98